MTNQAKLFAAGMALAGWLAGTLALAEAVPATMPSTVPSTMPGERRLSTEEIRKRETQRIHDYLRREYARWMKSKDWMARSLVVVCLNRVPGAETDAQLIEVISKDAAPAVRIVAWQCMLSRAPYLDEAEFKAWMDATWPLVETGAFRGQLRVGLFQAMATLPPDVKLKRIFFRIFDETSSLDPDDIHVLRAMGKCLATWQSPDVAEQLLRKLGTPNETYRAELVLHSAGCNVPFAGGRLGLSYAELWRAAIADYAAWWREEKPRWTEVKAAAPQAWRGLRPQFIPDADLNRDIDPRDPAVVRDLELKPPALRSFDVAFVVDATGSMGWAHRWLSGELRRVLKVLETVCLEPRIGLTFYRDHGDKFVTQTIPLTPDVDKLIGALDKMEAIGGGDVPEAVLDGLRDCMAGNRWMQHEASRKAIVLIGDAPPHEKTQTACEELAREAVKKGYRIYAIKAWTSYSDVSLGSFDAIALAGGGSTVKLGLEHGNRKEFWGRSTVKVNRVNERYMRTAVARVEPDPGQQILAAILADAIAPQYRQRVEPLAGILLELMHQPTPETREQFGPAPPIPPPKPPKPSGPKKDRQAQ